MKQGQLGGILKELGYTEEQVISISFFSVLGSLTRIFSLQVFKF
jgi:hypothetical protein